MAELHRKERRVAALQAELQELRGECLRARGAAGAAHGLLARRDVEM